MAVNMPNNDRRKKNHITITQSNHIVDYMYETHHRSNIKQIHKNRIIKNA